jgi:hypothetical protein
MGVRCPQVSNVVFLRFLTDVQWKNITQEELETYISRPNAEVVIANTLLIRKRTRFCKKNEALKLEVTFTFVYASRTF